MAVVALVNQKGGVGKTTVTLGLAGAAAAIGIRTLVIDIDPQANATTGLGVWDPPVTVDVALAEERPGCLRECVIASGWPGAAGRLPMVVASSPNLASREPQLALDPLGAQDRLRMAMQGIDFDLVFIDCPPSLGLLTVNGLFAADCALVVTEPGAWATDGVAQMLRTIERISERRREPLGVAGMVVNRLGRTRDGQYWYQQLAELYPQLVLPPVHLRAAIAEAAAQSLPLHMLAPRPGAAEAAAEFDTLFRRVVLATRPRSGGSVDAEL